MGNSTPIKSLSFFFTAFFLLSGINSSSYGQSCPSVATPQQSFCDSQLATVGNLQAEGTGVVWYSSQDAAAPLDPSAPLIHGNTYFAGSSNGSCTGNREAVTVTVLGPPDITGYQEGKRQRAQTKQSLATIEFCVSDLQDHSLTLADLRTNVPDVEWYLSAAANAPSVPLSTPLENDTYYFAAQINPQTGCRTTKVRTRIVLTVEEAPAGKSVQTFNSSDAPTLSDIATSENNRYYASENSQVPLNPATPLEDGTTYYLTTWGETCESIDRLAVRVELQSPPNAGSNTSGVVFCVTQDPVNLVDYINGSDLGAPDRDGTFEPALENNIFDPSEFGPGDYEFTYTVEGNNEFPDQSTTISVTVAEAPDAGEDATFYFCEGDPPQDLFQLVEEMGVTTEGSFEPHMDGVFDPRINGVQELHLIYTVEAAGSCPADSARYIFLVRQAPEPPQVSGLPAPACATEQLTVGDLQAEGEDVLWYSDAELTAPAAESDLLVTGTYYATRLNASGCESQPSSVNVVINDAPTPSIEEGGAVFCTLDEPPRLADLEENMNESNITWYDAPSGGNILERDLLLQDGGVYYASLTDPASGCESSQRLEVPVSFKRCKLPIPDAFSPNGDGINDVFEVKFAAENYPNYSIEIFNRWGNKVFTGNSSRLWDGTSDTGVSGDHLPTGVYFYIFYFNDGQTEPVQGRLYLSR